MKVSRGQMVVDWQPVHLAPRLAQPGSRFGDKTSLLSDISKLLLVVFKSNLVSAVDAVTSV